MEDELDLNENEELSRNQLQKIAMTSIYDVLTYADMKEKVDVESIVSSLCDAPYSECDYFVKATTVMAIKEYDKAVDTFNANMRKWTFSRLNRVEQAILLLSYVHYFYVDPNVDKGIVIDIAIKLAKTYLEDKDYKFVNAILDKVLNRESEKIDG